MRGETIDGATIIRHTPFQSTPLMRGETNQTKDSAQYHNHFNPLPSCEGRPSCVFTRQPSLSVFQSTPLMRGETSARPFIISRKDISIHSPHARGDTTGYVDVAKIPISIHSPHARGDRPRGEIVPRPNRFQSTPLMRGETEGPCTHH